MFAVIAVYFLKSWFHPFKIDFESAKLWIVKRGEGLLFAKQVNQLPSFKIACQPSPFIGVAPWTYQGRFISAPCAVATSRPMNVCCWPLLMTRRWSSVPWRNDDSWPPTWDTPTGYVARTLLGFTGLDRMLGMGALMEVIWNCMMNWLIIDCIVCILDVWWFEWVECFVSIVLVLRCICCAAAYKKT